MKCNWWCLLLGIIIGVLLALVWSGVIQNPTPPPAVDTIGGKVWREDTPDCVQNETVALPNVHIIVDGPNGYHQETNTASGQYMVGNALATGAYTVMVSPPPGTVVPSCDYDDPTPNGTPLTPNVAIVNHVQGQGHGNVNFSYK